MEFHDEFPNYEVLAQHDEATGKVKRKALWKVFWIMLVITIVELFIGLMAEKFGLLDELKRSGITLKFVFLTLTIVKAAYIVMEFMHLGHENKFSKWVILAPYITFIVYLAMMGTVGEGNYSNRDDRRFAPPARYTEQKAEAVKGHHGGAHEEGTHEGAERHEGATETHEGAEHK